MNEQIKLSADDAARLMELRLREELVRKDMQIAQLELRLFGAHISATYGNPNEHLEVASDNSLIRTPKVEAAP